jgi:hypothetical protein
VQILLAGPARRRGRRGTSGQFSFGPFFDLSGMAKNKKSLRNALNSHQVKMFQQRQFKAVEAHKKAGLKKDLAKGKDRVARKSVIPYNDQDTVLLIGEGALFSLEHDLY